MSGIAKIPPAGADTTPFAPGDYAPSLWLPLAFMLTGLASLLAGGIWLAAQPVLLATYHYNQYIIAVTHLFVLGGIGSVVMGALYQLVPVALETRLYSERLARWQFVLHVIGCVGLVWMFRKWDLKQVGHFGSVLAAGVGLLVYNLARTLRRAPKWNVTAAAVASALVWISLAVAAGLALAAAKCSYDSTEGLATVGGVRAVVSGLRALAGFMARFDALSAMHAHAHLGSVGFFTMLIVGVSYKLVPMFTLSEIQSRRRAAASVALLNIGLIVVFVAILLRSPWKLAGTLTILAALGLYVWELAAILRARKRGGLDWGLRTLLTAVALLLPVAILSVVLSWPGLPLNPATGQLENLYGFLGLIGVLTFAITGMLYKIIPFLVWLGAYGRHIGRARVPSLAEMYSVRLQAAGYGSFVGGLAIAGAGILQPSPIGVRLGCVLLALSLALQGVNAAAIVAHLFRPRLWPLAPPQPETGVAS